VRSPAVGWRGLSATAVTVALVAAVGWSAHAFLDSADPPSRSALPGDTGHRPPPPAPICAAEEDCLRIAPGQWVGVRPGREDAGFVLVDAGGPGQANLDTATIEDSLPAVLRGRTVVKLYEPWLDRPADGRCREGLAATSWSPTVPLGAACADSLAEVAQADLEPLVRSVSVLLGRELDAVVAYSFGATRTRQIWPMLDPDEGVLLVVQPNASAALGIEEVLGARSRAAWAILTELRQDLCSERNSCPTAEQLRTVLRSEAVDPRWQLSGPDLSLLVVAAVADLERYRPYLAKIVSGKPFSHDDLNRTEPAALALTHSTGPFHAPSSNAGYRMGMCQAYGEPSVLVPAQATTDPLERVLRAQVGRCPEPITGRYPEPTATPPARSCVLTAADDPAVPKELLDAVADFGENHRLEYDSGRGQVWPAKVTAGLQITAAGCSAAP